MERSQPAVLRITSPGEAAQLIPYLFPPGQGYWPALVVLDEDLHPLLLPDLYAYQDPIAFLAERLQ